MTRACLAALASHWRRNPLQSFAFLVGLALATALWSGVQAINAEARASYDAAVATLGDGQFDQILPRAGDRIAQQDFVTLRRAGWLVSPIIEGRLDGVRLLGFDPLSSPARFGVEGMAEAGDPDSFLSQGQLYATAETAQALGDGVTVLVEDTITPGIAVGDVGAVQQLLRRGDLSRLLVQPDQPLRRPALEDLAPHLRLQSASQSADVGELTESFHLNLTAFGLLSFAVGLFIVYSTIGLAFEQRRGMVRTLRALGVPLPHLITLMVAEVVALALVGAGIGVVLGYVIAALLLPDVAGTLRGLYGAEMAGTLQFRVSWWGSGMAIAVLGALAAAGGRLWQIARMPLLASARPRAWAMTLGNAQLVQGVGALGLLLCAGALAVWGSGLVAGFALLGCFLIGAALALPLLVRPVLALAEGTAKSPVARWFWADTRQQLPGLSLALMALLLAISANIGVATMVSSFRLTFVAFLDQRLAPELYVEAETAGQAAAIEAAAPRLGATALPLLVRDTQVAGQPTRLFGVRVGPTYRENWQFLAATPSAWDQVAAGTAAVANEQLARRAGLWIGDLVEVAPDRMLPLAAIVADYGNPRGQLVIGEALFQSLHPEVSARQFGLRTDDAATLRRALSDEVGIADSAITDQVALKAFSMSVFDRTFTVTAALNVLTLAVAGFAMLMCLLTLADLRVPQLAPVWALGLTRRRIGQLEVIRALVFAGVVCLFALPVGLGLAWVLLAIINVEAFGWRLPMYLFPADYARLGAYAILAAGTAAAWPAIRLMRVPPNALLKVFAHEH
ncbi:ABC transporter permease [uncultured Tateyamaria sp.]|uniref:ABC transporter permease n=1 Tax=uncultured Tateyamaria sp. TaxID=455651 RepID=UPI002637A810|nr:ABC transporter permease [uncultured Tateyamaria sp.]